MDKGNKSGIPVSEVTRTHFSGGPNLRNEWVLVRSARAITLAWWSLKDKAGDTGSQGCRATAGKFLSLSQKKGCGQELRTREGHGILKAVQEKWPDPLWPDQDSEASGLTENRSEYSNHVKGPPECKLDSPTSQTRPRNCCCVDVSRYFLQGTW